MRGRSIHNQQPFQMRSPQRAISPVIQIVPQTPQIMNFDIVINLKLEKVLMSFEIQRLNSVLLDVEKKRIALKNQNQKLLEREQIMLLEISNQKQLINDLQQKEKNNRDKLYQIQRSVTIQENQQRDHLMNDQLKKLQGENVLLEQKISYLLGVNQLQSKNNNLILQNSGSSNSVKDNFLPQNLQIAFENLQNNIIQLKKGNLLQNKYANALTMFSELINSHNKLLKQQENNNDKNEVEQQQIQIYLTSINQDIEALKQYETPKAVRRMLNNQSPTKFKSLSPSMSTGEVFSKIISHLEHLQLDGNNIPTIIKQISLLNSLVRLKNQDLKLIGSNNKLRSSPIHYSAERLNTSVRVLTPVKYVSPIRISPIRSHTFHSNVGIPQKIQIIHSNKPDKAFIDFNSQQIKEQLKSKYLQNEQLNANVENQFWKQKYEEEIEKQKKRFQAESPESQLLDQIKKNQELLSYINLMQNDLHQQELQNELELQKKQDDIIKLMETQSQQQQQKLHLQNQIDDLLQNDLENKKSKQNMIIKLQQNDEEIERLKNRINLLQLMSKQQDNLRIQLCEPLLIEKNFNQVDQQDLLQEKNLELQEKIIDLQDQLNKINSQPKKTKQNLIQTEISDPEKAIKISQLEQENQKLKFQLKEIELQRKDDLKEFQQMIGNGVSQQNIINIMTQKQQLQENFRVQQNKIDALQQNQIRLQTELIIKDKNQTDLELQLQNQQNPTQIQDQTLLLNQINNLQIKLDEAKQQYQELLETLSQNLTPNGLKEKILQQQAIIHEQNNQISILSEKIEQQIPYLQGQLAVANEKVQNADQNIIQQDKRFNDLLNNKQNQNNPQQQISDEDFKEVIEKNQELEKENRELQQKFKEQQIELEQQNLLKDEIQENIREQKLVKQLNQIQQDQIKEQQSKINKMIEKELKFTQEIEELRFKLHNYQEPNIQEIQISQKDDIIQNQNSDSNLQILQLQEELNQMRNQNQLKENECKNLQILHLENEELRTKQTQLYNQIIQLQNQIEQLECIKPSLQYDPNDQKIKFETDPEKSLALSQLQQENQLLKNQMQELEDQRTEDIKKFQEMIEDSENKQNIIELLQSKQILQQQLRNLQNQLDKTLQEQILLQGLLFKKNKQIVELQSNQNDDEIKKQFENQKSIIEEFKDKLQQSKNQYQELLEISSQNLTPNGQREKLLQNANQIHEQQQQIQQLHHQLENEVPQLLGELAQFKQKHNDSQTEIKLLMESYQNLLNQRSQNLQQLDQFNDQSYSTIKNINLQDTNLSGEKQENKKNDQTNISDYQDDLIRKNNLLEQEILLMQQQKIKFISELEDLHQKNTLKDSEILILKNKVAEENTEFWKEEYTKLASQIKNNSQNQILESEQNQIQILQQQNQKLKSQILEIETQRQEDLKKFQNVLENGDQGNQLLQLFSERQQLQSSQRQMQNIIDELQQKIKQKDKQLNDSQDSLTIQNLCYQIQELQNQNQLFQKQLQLSKEQYSQLQEQSVVNLSPNDLKEKLLQNSQTIHQQQEEILILKNQIQTDQIKSTDQLQQTNQKLQNALQEIQNWKESNFNLQEIQQEIPQIQIDEDLIKDMNLEQAQQQLQLVVQNYKQANESQQQAKNIINEQKNLINKHENQIKKLQQQNLEIQQENYLLRQLNQSQINQIEKLNDSNQTQCQEIIDQQNQQTGEIKKQITEQNQQVLNIHDLKILNELLQKQLENQLDQIKINKIEHQEQLLQAQNQINDLLKNQVKTVQSSEQIQFQTDPEKLLQLSQLKQQNESLRLQIEELEQNRKKDLQKFQDMIENGVNENSIVILLSEKQKLQSDLRVIQNKLDLVQQEQLILQSQLTQKTKQLIDIHDDIKQDETKRMQLQLQNQNDILKKQLDKTKEQYQELLQIQSENLTPNGLQEKILQQTKIIHNLEEKVQNLQLELEIQLPQLSGEITQLKLKLKDAVTDAQFWNSKYNEVIQVQQENSDDKIQLLLLQLAQQEEKIEKEKLKFDQLLNEQYNQLSPSSAQAKLLKALQQIADLEEKLEKSEDLKNQYQKQLINSNQFNQIEEELQSSKKQVQMLEKVNEVQVSQIQFYKNQLSEQNQISPNQQIIEQLSIEKQKSEFWKKQYTDIISQQQIQENLQFKINQKEDELISQFKQPQDQNFQDLLNEMDNLKQQNIYLQQLVINTQSKIKSQQTKESIQENPLNDIDKQDLEQKNQILANQVEELKKQNENILVQMNKALSGDDKTQQISELIEKNNLLSLTNGKLLIDLEANQKELLKYYQQPQKQDDMINSFERSEKYQNEKQRSFDLQNQVELLVQQLDFWKQKYQQVLNDFSQQHSPNSLQNQVAEQVSQIHQQEEALFILQQTTDQVKIQNEAKINQLQLEIEIMKNENENIQKKLTEEQNIFEQLSQQKRLQQENNEKQIKFWKVKYEETLKNTIENHEGIQAILSQDEEAFAKLNIDQNLNQFNLNSELIDRLRVENQKFQSEIVFYKKRVLELEQQQQKIEPSQQDTIQSRQYQITQLERDLQKAIQNQEYWQVKYNDAVKQNIEKEIGLKGDTQNSVSFWKQKYDQSEKSRQELIQKLIEKDEQLEYNMQSFQSMLKDELKEELTKIRLQERQIIQKQQLDEKPKNEINLIEKLKQQHEIEKQQLIQEFLRRIDQLLISNVQKYPDSENWKELILKYEKQRQNELYELKQQLQILQRSQIQTQDIEFYAERRAYENTINELKNRIQNSDQQELFDTIEYQRKVIQGLEDQISLLQNEKLQLNRHIQEQSQEIDMLRDNIQKYQIQSDNRKKQRLEVMEAISEMKRDRTIERDSQKSPYKSVRPSQNRQSWNIYPREYLRPSNITQQYSQIKEHQSPIQRIPYQSTQFLSPQQENLEIPAKLQELDEIKYKYQKAYNTILKLETQVVEKLQQDDIIIQ